MAGSRASWVESADIVEDGIGCADHVHGRQNAVRALLWVYQLVADNPNMMGRWPTKIAFNGPFGQGASMQVRPKVVMQHGELRP